VLRERFVIVLVVVVSAVGGVGCSGSGKRADSVATLTEFKIAFSKADLKAGKVKIKAENRGGTEHELVIVRAADAAALPKAVDGSVDEARISAADKVGEIAEVAPHADTSKTFDLQPGNYVAFCNIVDKGAPPVIHFKQGMFAQLSVSS
jgi:hypothetical protein